MGRIASLPWKLGEGRKPQEASQGWGGYTRQKDFLGFQRAFSSLPLADTIVLSHPRSPGLCSISGLHPLQFPIRFLVASSYVHVNQAMTSLHS